MGTKEYKFLFEDMHNVGLAAAGAPHTTAATPAVTADQLWELIDTFQRLYLVPAQSGSGGAPTAATSVSPKLMYHTVAPYDPVRETFETVYDPQHTGEISAQSTLRPLMARIGFGELNDEELALLVRTADFNRDGKITLEDFRELVRMKGRYRKESTDSSDGSGKKKKK
ncbi:hypothetical protein AGDE_07123 [Angomonas deanei]|uniref:EF-hand domain pair, putative n=1 Tax=Angomonas deanei TaxID=59799 RepID=A0A7G2C7C3_9TRYP|nr:hypothetical protein AGDE_07123 [Angomonas deanei]CAD2215720.1 EF-hand domain pair, putative [Angomonas deanei]|eukprot:EPY36020.1 hypothetical protein AGDE_07123 [Angomonas deanei]